MCLLTEFNFFESRQHNCVWVQLIWNKNTLSETSCLLSLWTILFGFPGWIIWRLAVFFYNVDQFFMQDLFYLTLIMPYRVQRIFAFWICFTSCYDFRLQFYWCVLSTWLIYLFQHGRAQNGLDFFYHFRGDFKNKNMS